MQIPDYEFTLKMYPRGDIPSTFKYPADRLLKLQGIIPEAKLRSPDMLDRDGEPCLFVIKSGKTTGVTIGRATVASPTSASTSPTTLTRRRRSGSFSPTTTSPGPSPPPATRARLSLTARARLAVSSPAVPARRSSRTSRTRRPATGSLRKSGTTGFPTPPYPRSWSRVRHIDQNDIGDAGC